MIAPEPLVGTLAEYLPRQRWFAGRADVAPDLRLASMTPLCRTGWPGMLQILVEARLPGGDAATYQLVVGLRPAGCQEAFLEGKPEAPIGELDSELGPALVYDAAVDPELAVALLHHIAPDEKVERARYLGADQSNTSVVFDERLILKLFRRLAAGPNPDAEVTRALVEAGFTKVPEPVAEWRGDAGDFAVVNEFLVGGTDGFLLALTSLRDLYDRRCPPGEAGGDFAFDSGRLGMMTAELHLALARAFGATPGDAGRWADDMERQLERVALGANLAGRCRELYDRLRHLADPGPAIRVHGDYHLGQVMRTDAGWHVLDFEGEPDRPLEERRRPSSPLRDVAGLVRSFHYAPQVALTDWGPEPDPELLEVAEAWERRNAGAFVAGYLATDRVNDVLPATAVDRRLVQAAFELDKAVYEVGYEQSHRPEWVGIPLAAVHRILEATR